MGLDLQTVELLKFGWGVLVTVCSLGVTIVMLWLTRHFVRRPEFEKANGEIDKALEDHSARLIKLETEMRQLPRHSDLVAITHQLSEVGGRISRLEGQTQQTNNLLSAIHEHLLNEK